MPLATTLVFFASAAAAAALVVLQHCRRSRGRLRRACMRTLCTLGRISRPAVCTTRARVASCSRRWRSGARVALPGRWRGLAAALRGLGGRRVLREAVQLRFDV
jgi:hypothetical protein